jgi:hypothetical protein
VNDQDAMILSICVIIGTRRVHNWRQLYNLARTSPRHRMTPRYLRRSIHPKYRQARLCDTPWSFYGVFGGRLLLRGLRSFLRSHPGELRYPDQSATICLTVRSPFHAFIASHPRVQPRTACASGITSALRFPPVVPLPQPSFPVRTALDLPRLMMICLHCTSA